MEIAEIKFAYRKPDVSGACDSPEEREVEISAFLRTVKWIHPGRFVSRRGEPDSVEAVVVLRRPAPSRPSAVPDIWEKFNSWLQKKLPKFFDGSLCSFKLKFEWSAYRIRSKNELLFYYAVNDASLLRKQGYDVQVVQPEVEKLHRLFPNPCGIIHPEPKEFSEFLKVQSYVARFALSR